MRVWRPGTLARFDYRLSRPGEGLSVSALGPDNHSFNLWRHARGGSTRQTRARHTAWRGQIRPAIRCRELSAFPRHRPGPRRISSASTGQPSSPRPRLPHGGRAGCWWWTAPLDRRFFDRCRAGLRGPPHETKDAPRGGPEVELGIGALAWHHSPLGGRRRRVHGRCGRECGAARARTKPVVFLANFTKLRHESVALSRVGDKSLYSSRSRFSTGVLATLRG